MNINARGAKESWRLSTAEKVSPAKETWSEYSSGGDGSQKSSFKDDEDCLKEDDNSRAKESACKRERPKEAGRRS